MVAQLQVQVLVLVRPRYALRAEAAPLRGTSPCLAVRTALAPAWSRRGRAKRGCGDALVVALVVALVMAVAIGVAIGVAA